MLVYCRKTQQEFDNIKEIQKSWSTARGVFYHSIKYMASAYLGTLPYRFKLNTHKTIKHSFLFFVSERK